MSVSFDISKKKKSIRRGEGKNVRFDDFFSFSGKTRRECHPPPPLAAALPLKFHFVENSCPFFSHTHGKISSASEITARSQQTRDKAKGVWIFYNASFLRIRNIFTPRASDEPFFFSTPVDRRFGLNARIKWNEIRGHAEDPRPQTCQKVRRTVTSRKKNRWEIGDLTREDRLTVRSCEEKCDVEKISLKWDIPEREIPSKGCLLQVEAENWICNRERSYSSETFEAQQHM